MYSPSSPRSSALRLSQTITDHTANRISKPLTTYGEIFKRNRTTANTMNTTNMSSTWVKPPIPTNASLFANTVSRLPGSSQYLARKKANQINKMIVKR